MLLLELFSGTGSIGKVAKKKGMKVLSVDIRPDFHPDILCDILKLDYKKLPIPNAIWASPPCTSFSMLSFQHHLRDPKTLKPLTPVAILGNKLLFKTLEIISYFKRKNPNLVWCIENPVGMMRHMNVMKRLPRVTTTYCKYGFPYKKPTDLWNNFNLQVRRQCSSLSRCHYWKKHGCHIPAAQQSTDTLYRIPIGLATTIIESMQSSLV